MILYVDYATIILLMLDMIPMINRSSHNNLANQTRLYRWEDLHVRHHRHGVA